MILGEGCMVRHTRVPLLGLLVASACRVTPPAEVCIPLIGSYAGPCEAGDGKLDLHEDGSFLLWLAEARNGAQWRVAGQWYDGGILHADPLHASPAPFDGNLRSFALVGQQWTLQWSARPGLTRGDSWSPPMTYGMSNVITADGQVWLNAWAPFILRRQSCVDRQIGSASAGGSTPRTQRNASP